MVVDLISGQVQAAFDNLPASMPYIKEGKLRPLGVTTKARWPALAETTPIMADYMPGFEATTWIGIAAPKKTPADIVDRLSTEISAGIADPMMIARLAELGAIPFPISTVEFDKFIAEQTEKWGKVIRAANIKLE